MGEPYIRTEELNRAIKEARRRGDTESADALELATREVNRLVMLATDLGWRAKELVDSVDGEWDYYFTANGHAEGAGRRLAAWFEEASDPFGGVMR